MTCLERLGCPSCEKGVFDRKLVGACMTFLSKRPGDVLIKEVYKTVVECTHCDDAPTVQVHITDIAKSDERVINSYI